MKVLLVSILAATFTLISVDADARSFRVNQVPNNQWGCALCHIGAGGGGPRNGFGVQVENSLEGPLASADVDWAAVSQEDADRDGYSNGYELGDPEGTWTVGDPNPDGDVFDPNNADDSPCGDGVLDPQEECDSTELNGAVCADGGFGPGEVTCSATCEVDFSACEGAEEEEPEEEEPEEEEEEQPDEEPDSNNDPGEDPEEEFEDDLDDMRMGTDDDGGCAVAGGSPAVWALMLGLFGLRRMRRS